MKVLISLMFISLNFFFIWEVHYVINTVEILLFFFFVFTSDNFRVANSVEAERFIMASARTHTHTHTQNISSITITGWTANVFFYTFCCLILIIIINIKDWTLWSVPSPELQLLTPTLLRSSNCSPSLWSVVVWFQRDSVLWRCLQV